MCTCDTNAELLAELVEEVRKLREAVASQQAEVHHYYYTFPSPPAAQPVTVWGHPNVCGGAAGTPQVFTINY